MTRLIHHIRSNVVAYLALFVALGGTSYAAVSVPRNSVGAPQIRNHSITALKFNQKSIAGHVSAWVLLRGGKQRIAPFRSSAHVRVLTGSQGENVIWPHRSFGSDCAASVTPVMNQLPAPAAVGSITEAFIPNATGGAVLQLYGMTPSGVPTAQAADVLIVCP